MTNFPPAPLAVHRARGFAARLGGLLVRAELRAGEGLVLMPCRSVHTWFMAYAIDVVFVDRSGRVLRVASDVAPWRVVTCPGAHAAVELRAGEAATYGFVPGAMLPPTVLGD